MAAPDSAGLTANEMAARLAWLKAKGGNQTKAQLVALLKKQLHVEEIANGCIVQTISLPDLARHLNGTALPSGNDPVWQALTTGTFNECANSGVDVLNSIRVLSQLRRDNAIRKGCVLLAWSFKDGQLRELIGAAVVSEFVQNADFGTAVLSPQDMSSIGAYFTKHAYIDTMCASQVGVGPLLVRHAYVYACKNFGGLTALAMHIGGSTQSAPDHARFRSQRMFHRLGFTVHGPTHIKPTNTQKDWYRGSWVTLLADKPGVTKMLQQGMSQSNPCVRVGLTATTNDRLMWRC